MTELRDLLPYLTKRERAEIDALLAGVAPKLGLVEYVRQCWQVVEPATPYVHGWHIDAICEHLEAITRGELQRLIINVPPRHMKSLLVSVFWPTWEWTQYPSRRFLTASYAQNLSTRDAVKSRRILLSPWYQERWGSVFSLTGDQNEKMRYENDQAGYRIATSVGGTATGEGGDRLVLDDPHKAGEILSTTIRETDIDWLRETWSTRLNDPKNGAEVIVMQRLHERDATGYLLAEVGGYEHLCLPAQFEPARRATTVLGWSDPRQVEGELLWGDRYDAEALEKLSRALGSYGVAGQLQQRPSPAGGGIVKGAWFKDHTEAPVRFDEILQSWDMAFKKTDGGSYVAGQVWGRTGANKYLLARVHQRLSFPDTKRALRQMTTDWPQARLKLVEDKANGPAIIDELRDEIPGLVPVQVDGSKEARMHAVSPDIEAGNVHLPHPDTAPWVREFVGNIESFPRGENDDGDAMSQALQRLGRGADLGQALGSGVKRATAEMSTAGRSEREYGRSDKGGFGY